MRSGPRARDHWASVMRKLTLSSSLFWWAAALTALCGGGLLVWGNSLSWNLLDMTFRPGDVSDTLEWLSGQGLTQSHLWMTMSVDTLFPPAYCLLLLTAHARYLRPPDTWFLALIIATLTADYTENGIQIALLRGSGQVELERIKVFASIAKVAGITLSVAVLGIRILKARRGT